MAGPDLPRPPIEDQLGSGVARQQVLPDGDKLPDGCNVGPYSFALLGPGLWVAEVDVKTPEGRERVLFSSVGGLQRRPLGPQKVSSSIGPKI